VRLTWQQFTPNTGVTRTKNAGVFNLGPCPLPGQGGDTCRYENSEIHAIRILAMEPTTDPRYTGKPWRMWCIVNAS
jgi:hypothetical protein